MLALEKTTPLTADQFWEIIALPEYADRRFELIAGEMIEMSESSSFNSIIAVRFASILRMFVDEHQLGWVTGPDGGYRLNDRNVRQPDAAFISKERLPTLTRRIVIAPDIAVEVISPSETTPAVSRKAALYLQIRDAHRLERLPAGTLYSGMDIGRSRRVERPHITGTRYAERRRRSTRFHTRNCKAL